MDGHGIDPHRVEWLPSEIDTELFLPADTSPTKARLLFTGAICRNKGIDILLEALTHLDNSEWTLRLVGRILPWERKWFEDALKASGLSERVDCPGAFERAALLHEYRHAHLYVFPHALRAHLAVCVKHWRRVCLVFSQIYPAIGLLTPRIRSLAE